jgi:Uri superfamily endonuclease
MATMLESVIQAIPREGGSYALWLHLPQTRDLIIGRLGSFTFPAGDYVYLGSARGPGGLRARLGRHLRGRGQAHWHIDRLRAAAQVHGFGYKTISADVSEADPSDSRECNWSQRLATLPEASLPAPGFGSSDCRSGCAAHLVHFPGGVEQSLVRIANKTGIPLEAIFLIPFGEHFVHLIQKSVQGSHPVG